MPVESLLAECEIRFSRRSGPGGQHRNKVETAVTLTHRPTGVAGEASERRSQGENREMALMRLRTNLAVEVRRPEAWGEESSPLFRSRVRGGRIEISDAHADFPAMLAEALDRILSADGDIKPVAGLFGCSATQLVRFLQKDHRALALVNRHRAATGLHPLR